MLRHSIFYLLPAIIFLATACGVSADHRKVKVVERQIHVNDEPYLIKGICYNPIQKGDTMRSFENLTEDLALMQEAGINTIRVYSPIDEKAVLDEIHEAGIKVIIGFGYNQGGYYDILSGSFIDYINAYKQHEAILFWELGNEYNYHPEWFEGSLENWYKALNEAAALAKKMDPDHPVATAHGELPDATALSMSPNVEIWGLNVYRSDKPASIFSQWEEVSSKPMYLSEAGADSYMTIARDGFDSGVNELAQATAVENILKDVFENQDVCSGVTVFEFSDEWWKAGNPDVQDPGGWAPNSFGVPYDGAPNEEYWGIVNVDRTKKKAFDVVKSNYTGLNK
jgi:hypothetical protein